MKDNRVILIVLDSVGIGELPYAIDYNTTGVQVAIYPITDKKGSVRWNSSNMTSGTYYFALFDDNKVILSTKSLIIIK